VLYTEGRFDEGLELARRGAELDPLTPFNHHNIGFGLYYARQYEAAAERYERVIQDFPDYGLGHYGLSKVNRRMGKTKEAVKQVEVANVLLGDSFFARLAEAESYAADGMAKIAAEKVKELEELSEERYVSPYQIALVYCYLGDNEKAIEYLQKAAQIKEAWLNWMGVDPVLDPLRSDERFEEILENIGYRPLFSNFAKTGTSLANRTSDAAAGNGEKQHVHDLTTLVIDEGPITSDVSTGPVTVKRNRGYAVAASVILFAVLLGAGSYFYFSRAESRPGIRAATFQNPAVVVLPFNSGDQANDNLGVGLADTMAQRLGYLKALTVISPNTGRFLRDAEPSRIAEELGVAFVIRGTLNKGDAGATLEAELVNATANEVIWTETFVSPNGDYFDLQKQVAERLWTTLGIHPLPLELQQIEKSYTRSSAAYERYLIGRSQMASRDAQGLRRSIGSFAAAIEEDPKFAPAFVGLADAHSLLNLYDVAPPPDAYSKALQYAQRALEIDGDLAEAHASLAYIKFYHQRDRAGAELEFRRAIQLNPSYAQAHHWFALALAAMGKPVDALSEIETAQRLDPRSLSIKAAAAIVHFFAGQNSEAITVADRALAMDPRFVPAHKVKRWVFAAMGNLPAARESLARERLHSGGSENDPGWKVIECQLAGGDPDLRAAATRELEEAIRGEGVKGNDYYFAFEIALSYNHLGNTEKALEWLERSESAGTHGFNLMESDPRLANLHSEPRFQRLAAKLHKTQ
jgi:tetratricopeptide (TPR) repeat protein